MSCKFQVDDIATSPVFFTSRREFQWEKTGKMISGRGGKVTKAGEEQLPVFFSGFLSADLRI